MIRHTLCVFAVILVGFVPTLALQGADKPAPETKELFNGKTLEGWKVTDFGGQGKVEVRDGTIVMQRGSQMTGITWSGKPPRNNYELTLEGKRIEGSDFFCTTTFPVGDDYCSFVTGGWGGSVIGLSNVDHMTPRRIRPLPAANSRTARGTSFASV